MKKTKNGKRISVETKLQKLADKPSAWFRLTTEQKKQFEKALASEKKSKKLSFKIGGPIPN